MKHTHKFGVLAASFVVAGAVAVGSFGGVSGAFAAETKVDAPAGFGDPITVDVSATNEALNHWQYYISGTLDDSGNSRGDAYYEDKNVHFRATENGRTGNALWIDKQAREGSIIAYPYAIDVVPSQNYAISAYVKSNCDETVQNTVSFMVKELDENGVQTSKNNEFTILSTVSGTVNDWKKVEFPFTTSENGSKIILKIEFKGKGDFYLDDIVVQTSSVSINTVSYKMFGIGKLSEGATDELSNCDDPEKVALKGMYGLTTANISTDSSDGDGASLLLNDGELFKTNFSALSPDKTYRLSFKYKHVKLGSLNTLSIRHNYYDLEGNRLYYDNVINGSPTEWLTFSRDFKGTEGYASQGIAITSNAQYLIDELSLVCLDENDPMQYIANGSFSGAYTEGYFLGENVNVSKQADGTGVFAVSNGVYNETFGHRGFVKYEPKGLTPGNEYTLSFDYRFEGADWVNSILVYRSGSEIINITGQDIPDRWNNRTYKFTAQEGDFFEFYGPSYYLWTTYYKNIKIFDAENNQLNPNVELVTPEPELGDNVFDYGTFEGNTEYVAEDWTFEGNAAIYGLVFDTRYEEGALADTVPDWKICLDGTAENPASAISKEIAVSQKTLAVALTYYNGSADDLIISAIAGETEIVADENGFIELPDGVASIKLKFTSEKYVAFRKISLVSHTHDVPAEGDITTVEATCTKAGGKTYLCSGCEKTIYLEKTPKLEHQLEHVHVDASCQNGVDKDVCVHCKAEFNVKVLIGNPQNHRYKEVIIKAPTCNKSGMKQEICEVCEATSGMAIIPATGEHDYENGVCTVCGEEDPDYVEPIDPVLPEEPQKSGCKSSVNGGYAGFAVLAAAAYVLLRRKKQQ
ncbi:MAG: carbohydrate binding domain-containing protein [Candidatus Borkfalkiaceae bacterium]|nr:carbohydrate binding domain-containing protein [Christensenellaceae bacterium]